MGTFRIYRRLQDLLDVDPNGLPDEGVPKYDTAVSSFVVETIAAGGSAFSAGVSTLGNTLGDTGITGTRLVLAGVGDLTLSQATDVNGGTITISGGNAGGVAISASNSLFSTGTVVLTGTGGGVTVDTQAAGTIRISVAAPVAQTVQTQDRFNLTLDGNTAGALQEVSSGTLTLAGGNGVTLSQNGNAITISGNTFSQSVQPETQTFIGGISASNTLYTSGSVRFTGSNIVTVRSGTGQLVVIDASTSQSVQTQNVVDVTLSGNTAGALALISSGTMTLAGGNNITVSQAGNAVTISGPNVGGAQTGISGIANSQTTFTSGTVGLLELGAITIRSTTGNQFQLSVNAQTGTQFSAGISGGNTAGDTGTVAGRVVLAGGANITLSGSTNGASETISIVGPSGGAFSAGISGGNTSGNTGVTGTRVVFAGGNNITLSGSTDANGGSVTMSAPNASVISAVAPLSTSTNGSTISILGPAQLSVGFSTQGNTSGNTGFVTGQLQLVGSNGITLSGSTNGGSQTITISGVTQSVESQSIGMSNLGNTSGTTGIASGGQVRFLLAGGNGVTLSQSLNGASGTLTISVATQTVESQSIGMSNIGNTSGTTGVASGGQVRFVFAGGNNITLSQSLNGASGTITISAPNLGAGAMSAGASNLGNTAGSTGITGTQLVLVGTNAISLSQSTGANGGTVSINAPATSSLSAVSGIKISTNGSTISIGYGLSLADWENMPRAQASLMSHLSGFSKTPIYWADSIQGDVTAKSLAFAVSMVTASQPLSLSAHLGVYSIVNSTSASLMGSVSEAYVVSSASSVSLSGVRNLIMTGIGTHATLSTISGGEYLIGMMFSATATQVMNASLLGASGGPGPLGGIYPGTNQLSTGTTQGIQQLAGRGSVTVNAMPNNVAASDVINQGTAGSMALHPWIYVRS